MPFADLQSSPRLDALAEVCRNAGWWWPMQGAVVLTDRPTLIARDKDARLHSAHGPALEYADGYSMHSWHGQAVPADLIDGDGWSVERIVKERNVEIRRCAVERIGWDTFIDRAHLELVAECPDPGNAPHSLALYEIPEVLQEAYSEPARIVLCTNGSQERDGSTHRFGIAVRATHTDPVAAMAESFGVPTHVYRSLEVRR